MTTHSQHDFSSFHNVLDRIFNHTYNGIAVVSMDGNWLKINESVCDIFGYTVSELFNMNIDNIVFVEDLGIHEENYEKLVSGEIDKYRIKQRYFHKDGSVIWVLIYVSLVYFKPGTPYMIWQFTDITSQQKNTNKLMAMLNVAKEQNERLTSFADIVTHNLRSHSGNLLSITNFLDEDFPQLNHNENYKLLKNAIDNLQETVSHLSQVSKIKEVAASELEILNLYTYVQKAMYSINALAKNAGAIIHNDIDEAINIMAVPAYLDSIVLNFMSNAIKYKSTERLPIISLSSEIQGDFVVFKIEDNGLGIDMEKFGDKIFQMYSTFHYNKDAVGIGLFITKNHIESLGGRVEVESEVNVGTKFSVYFKKP